MPLFVIAPTDPELRLAKGCKRDTDNLTRVYTGFDVNDAFSQWLDDLPKQILILVEDKDIEVGVYEVGAKALGLARSKILTFNVVFP